MADWFKFYENGLYEDRLQWAMSEHREVLDVWLWILSGCCRTKSDTLRWAGEDHELLGAAHTLHTSAAKINESIKLLARIKYIETTETTITVRKWADLQSEYMRKKAHRESQNVKECPDTIRTVSDSVVLEERRGEEIEKNKPSSERKRSSKGQLSDDEFISSLKRSPAYKGIDVERELARMDAWLLTPKGRRRKKTRQFIVNWLNRTDAPLPAGNGADPSKLARL